MKLTWCANQMWMLMCLSSHCCAVACYYVFYSTWKLSHEISIELPVPSNRTLTDMVVRLPVCFWFVTGTWWCAMEYYSPAWKQILEYTQNVMAMILIFRFINHHNFSCHKFLFMLCYHCQALELHCKVHCVRLIGLIYLLLPSWYILVEA